jgi:fibronectin-binding autotransporter adhesin
MKKIIRLISLVATLPMCLQAQNVFTSDPGAIDIDIAPSTVLDASGGMFTTNARFTGTGDLTVTGGRVNFNGGISTFVGDIFVNSTADLAHGSRVLGNTSNTVFLSGIINTRTGGATFEQNLSIQTSGVLIQPASSGTTQTWAGDVTFAGDHLLRIGNTFKVADRNFTISGDISGGGFTNARIDVIGDNSLFTFSGNNDYSGNTFVTNAGTRLNIDGTHTGGNITVDTGSILGGSGSILFQDGMTIANSGTFDLSSLLFDVSLLTSTGSNITLVDYTGGDLSNVPGDLQSILANSAGWTLVDNGSTLSVIPELSTAALFLGTAAMALVLLNRRN